MTREPEEETTGGSPDAPAAPGSTTQVSSGPGSSAQDQTTHADVVADGEGATAVDAPAAGTADGRDPLGPRGRFAVVWGVALGLVLTLFAVTVIVLNSTLFSAASFVTSYISALERHDLVSALDMPGVERQDDVADVLLRRDLLGDLGDIEVLDDENLGGGEHHVSVGYTLNGEPARTTFVVVRDTNRFGLFTSWRFEHSPLTTVEIVPQNAAEFTVNGTPVAAPAGPGEPSVFQVLVPGVFVFAHESQYLTADEQTVQFTATHRTEQVEIEMQASDEFIAVVEEELAAYLDECAASGVLQPAGCPFGKSISNRIISTPEWTVLEYPELDMVPGAETGTWVVEPAVGRARLSVDIMSLFDGRVTPLQEDITFTVSYLVTLTEGGGVVLTPRGDSMTG